MSDEDKFFNFMSGLQLWAQKELHMQVVRNLPAPIVVVDGLVDFKFANASLSESKKLKDGKKDNSSHDDGKTNNSQNKAKQGKKEFRVLHLRQITSSKILFEAREVI